MYLLSCILCIECATIQACKGFLGGHVCAKDVKAFHIHVARNITQTRGSIPSRSTNLSGSITMLWPPRPKVTICGHINLPNVTICGHTCSLVTYGGGRYSLLSVANNPSKLRHENKYRWPIFPHSGGHHPLLVWVVNILFLLVARVPSIPPPGSRCKLAVNAV